MERKTNPVMSDGTLSAATPVDPDSEIPKMREQYQI